MHPKIDCIIRKLKESGFIVKMTSIGGNKRVFEKIIDSGIDGINFSLHAIDKNEMYGTQVDRSERWIEQNHKKLMELDRKSTRLNSSHVSISYAVFCLKKKLSKHVGADTESNTSL